jgi:hypothetical protein
MKVLASLGFAAACLLASPAFAGPAGTGLTFTEEVAKKNLQKRIAKSQAAADCATPKALTASDVTLDTCRAS